jgi:spore coat protein U-like protein
MIKSLIKQLPSADKKEQLLSLVSNIIIIFKEDTIMKRTLMAVLFGIILAVMVVSVPNMAAAATASGSLSVTATVVGSCRVTGTTAVAFGNYDPTDTANNDVGQGSMTFRCTKGVAYMLWISGTRSMIVGTETLLFGLYTDGGRSSAFPSAAGSLSTTAASNAPVTTQIYGRINALQDVAAGSYSTTLTASVEY